MEGRDEAVELYTVELASVVDSPAEEEEVFGM